MNLGNFFAELKRWNVYQVAIAAAERLSARRTDNQFVNCGCGPFMHTA